MLQKTAFTEADVKQLSTIRKTFDGISAESAALTLKLSTRQVFRLKAKLRAGGDAGIIHGNCGRRPANALPEGLREHVLDLHRQEYSLYNACHFAEALEEEHHIKLSRETARRWLRTAGIPPKRRHKDNRKHRRRRPRRTRFGELLFLDGSPHHWLGPELPMLTLILATDDATGRPLWGLFLDQETLNGCLEVLYHVSRRFGSPGALYLDRAGQFTTTRHKGTHVTQRDDKLTHFETAMHRLGIELIFAHSPQARGRGERINGSFQDRLVAEFAHHQIKDPLAATRYLNQRFIPRYARRFGIAPADPVSAFRPIPEGPDLRTVLCAKEQRTVSNDNTISYKGQELQLLPTSRTARIAGTKVEVQAWFDGSVHVVRLRGGEIETRKLPPKPKPKAKSRQADYDVFAVH